MSLSSTTRRNDYTGNGAASVYAYSFRIFNEDDLTVIVRDTDNNETILTKTTDYTVSGVGTNGGNVTLVNASQAWLTAGKLTSNFVLTILRVVDLVQNTDIRNQGSFFPETHEEAFDYLTMIDQQQQDQIDRSIRLPPTIKPSDFDMELPADAEDHAGETIIINSTGDGLEFGAAPVFYYYQFTRPSAPPTGFLAFWDDRTTNQGKKWSPFTNDWETISS